MGAEMDSRGGEDTAQSAGQAGLAPDLAVTQRHQIAPPPPTPEAVALETSDLPVTRPRLTLPPELEQAVAEGVIPIEGDPAPERPDPMDPLPAPEMATLVATVSNSALEAPAPVDVEPVGAGVEREGAPTWESGAWDDGAPVKVTPAMEPGPPVDIAPVWEPGASSDHLITDAHAAASGGAPVFEPLWPELAAPEAWSAAPDAVARHEAPTTKIEDASYGDSSARADAAPAFEPIPQEDASPVFELVPQEDAPPEVEAVASGDVAPPAEEVAPGEALPEDEPVAPVEVAPAEIAPESVAPELEPVEPSVAASDMSPPADMSFATGYAPLAPESLPVADSGAWVEAAPATEAEPATNDFLVAGMLPATEPEAVAEPEPAVELDLVAAAFEDAELEAPASTIPPSAIAASEQVEAVEPAPLVEPLPVASPGPMGEMATARETPLIGDATPPMTAPVPLETPRAVEAPPVATPLVVEIPQPAPQRQWEPDPRMRPAEPAYDPRLSTPLVTAAPDEGVEEGKTSRLRTPLVVSDRGAVFAIVAALVWLALVALPLTLSLAFGQPLNGLPLLGVVVWLIFLRAARALSPPARVDHLLRRARYAEALSASDASLGVTGEGAWVGLRRLIWLNRRTSALLGLGRFDEALRAALTAMEQSPDPETIATCALALLRLNRYEDAITAARLVSGATHERSVRANATLAAAMLARGAPAEADALASASLADIEALSPYVRRESYAMCLSALVRALRAQKRLDGPTGARAALSRLRRVAGSDRTARAIALLEEAALLAETGGAQAQDEVERLTRTARALAPGYTLWRLSQPGAPVTAMSAYLRDGLRVQAERGPSSPALGALLRRAAADMAPRPPQVSSSTALLAQIITVGATLALLALWTVMFFVVYTS